MVNFACLDQSGKILSAVNVRFPWGWLQRMARLPWDIMFRISIEHISVRESSILVFSR
jgi:hypothetical protein